MKNSTRFFIGFSLLVLLGYYGCSAGRPEAEINAAQKAMDNARSLHAEELATQNWNEAMDAWNQGDAAVKQGKPSKTFFVRAKSRFEKTATIAKSQRDIVAQDISNMQMSIAERYSKIQSALERGTMSSKAQKQIKPIIAEVQTGNESIENLISHGEYLKARATARDVQKKIYDVELIMAGKKPAS